MMATKRLEGEEVANFLRRRGGVRDCVLRSLAVRPTEVEWDPILELVFEVPARLREGVISLS